MVRPRLELERGTDVLLLETGDALLTEDILGFEEAATVRVGVVVSATAIYEMVEVALVTIGVTISAIESHAMTRTTSIVVGVVASATRVRAMSKASSVIISVKVSATSVRAAVRTAIVKVGIIALGQFTLQRILRILGILSTDLTIKSTLKGG